MNADLQKSVPIQPNTGQILRQQQHKWPLAGMHVEQRGLGLRVEARDGHRRARGAGRDAGDERAGEGRAERRDLPPRLVVPVIFSMGNTVSCFHIFSMGRNPTRIFFFVRCGFRAMGTPQARNLISVR